MTAIVACSITFLAYLDGGIAGTGRGFAADALGVAALRGALSNVMLLPLAWPETSALAQEHVSEPETGNLSLLQVLE